MTVVMDQKCKLGKSGIEIPRLGFGTMGLSSAYGAVGSDEDRFQVLDRAWELGCTNWDTANVYGDSEDLIGKWFKLHPERRNSIFLATKFGYVPSIGEDGSQIVHIDSSAKHCREACEMSLQRLGLDRIDLYYIHRLNPKTPIEETMTELIKLKEEGKIRAIGISECSSATLRRACAIGHVDAVQIEYHPWALEAESETGTHLLQACQELDVTVFAYSPLGRGIMTGQYRSKADFDADDFRQHLDRFNDENFAKNLVLVEKFRELANRKGYTLSQLVLSWLMAQGGPISVIPIPGTKKIKYLEENWISLCIYLSKDEEAEMRRMVDEIGVAGKRDTFFGSYVDTAPA